MSNTKSVKYAFDLIEENKSKLLGLNLNGKSIAPGDYVQRADAQSPPSISFNAASPSKEYLVINLDLDAPFPSLAFLLSPILHWVQAGFRSSTSQAAAAATLETTAPFMTDYAAPAPPPGSSPHRYIFMLYEQSPATSRIIQEKASSSGKKPVGIWSRMSFDLEKFERENGLDRPVAMNYFRSN